MVREKCAVRLTKEERDKLERMTRVGKSSARVTARARILLKTDEECTVPQVDERVEDHLIALACSPATEGHDHWELRLLADRMVELGVVESLSHEAVRQHLKKTSSSRGRRSSGASQR